MNDQQKILIVDDKRENLIALERVLHDLDVEIIQVDCGNDALKATLNHDFALAILDVQMPEMDGYELAEFIRSEDKTKHLPMIFLSAVYFDETHVFKGYEAGGVDFVTKPYNPFYLISKVKVFLQLDKQKKELLEKIELEKSRNYLESILMSVNDSIVVFSLEGKIKTVNKATLSLWGYEYEEMIGIEAIQLFDNNIYTSWLHSLKNYEASLHKTDFAFHKIETTLIKKNKVEVPALISGSALLNRNGTIQGAVLVAVDISDRKKAELRIHQLNEEMEERVMERTHQLEISVKDMESFSYSVSHDLKTPLRAISGFTYALYEDYFEKLDEEGKDLIKIIVENTRKMGEIIEDLLSFSRLGRKEVVKNPADMNRIFIDSYNELKALSPARKINLTISQLLPCSADASLMHHVVTNLLSNAFKFTIPREEAEIEVASFEKDQQITYYVKDNGIGFNMKYADKLFGVFQRLYNSLDYDGSGVGLAIVYKVIYRHGGKVWAEAEENKGATFYFSLPK
ncbi:MAG: response regulator [Candidatus Cloacimonetes bacterium]|nr:response regulator [Candidatus Cloacimonadota bacterium]